MARPVEGDARRDDDASIEVPGGKAKGESQISTCMMFVPMHRFCTSVKSQYDQTHLKRRQAVPYSAHIRTILHYHLFD